MGSGVVDWRRGRGIPECNLRMLDSGECSDVTFRVGEDKAEIWAHRFVLVSRSYVFTAMFCGPLAEKGDITIPDIEADIFKEFLKYLYSDCDNLKPDNVLGLMYAARKYAVDSLFEKCKFFLENALSEHNIFDILDQCILYEEKDLETKALDILIAGGERMMSRPEFLSLRPDHLKTVLQSDKLVVEEEKVFTSTLEWAKEQCDKQNLEPSPESLRSVLGELIYEIRFPSMSLEYIVKTVGPTGILTRDERLTVIDVIMGPNANAKFFNTKRRNIKKVVSRFRALSSNSWICGGYRDSIEIVTRMDAELLGCQLYGPYSRDEAPYKVSIDVRYQGNVIERPFCMSLEGRGTVNDVMFPYPIRLRSDRLYTLCVTLTRTRSFKGEGGGAAFTMEGITVLLMTSI